MTPRIVYSVSALQAEQYFSSNEDRQCRPTAYARKQGANVRSDCCYWWLRSPGYDQDHAAIVNADGALNLNGDNVGCDDIAVRPALRIICNL